MKNLLLATLLLFSTVANAQTSKQVPAEIKAYKASQSMAVQTKDTVIAGQTVTVYSGARGGRYIWVTSKTGTQYKKYLPKG